MIHGWKVHERPIMRFLLERVRHASLRVSHHVALMHEELSRGE